MPYYVTVYKVKWFGSNGTYIKADSENQALEFMARRGLGETFQPNKAYPRDDPPPYTMPLITFLRCPYVSRGQKLHAMAWTCFLALGSGVATNEEVFGDGGVIHRLAHGWEAEDNSAMTSENNCPKQAFNDMWEIAKKIPGFVFSPYGHESTQKLRDEILEAEKRGGSADNLYL